MTPGLDVRWSRALSEQLARRGATVEGTGSFAHPLDGVITSPLYGNFTMIDHGMVDGKHVTTAYAHQERFLVKPGQVVHKGDPVGIVGQTGYATGPHLHFEVRENGTVVDPVSFLARN